jgi:hypothetical protein
MAGALDIVTGSITRCFGKSKKAGLFLELLCSIDQSFPMTLYSKVILVADNARVHKAAAVREWLEVHSRFSLLYLPVYCPRANPIERAFGDVHDCCTRNHHRRRLRDLAADVDAHLEVNGPWQYKLSSVYYQPEVTAAVEKLYSQGEKLAA